MGGLTFDRALTRLILEPWSAACSSAAAGDPPIAQPYLRHHASRPPQLPEGIRLTRAEWSALRGGLGRPRRLSLTFLRRERAALELYRETVRRAYAEAAAAGGGPGAAAALPPGAPRPLRVGQAVVARHPVTKRLADGIILTTQPNRYRVQFHR
jgi:hypothetical protein